MFSNQAVESKLKASAELQRRVEVLRVASKINSDFRNPNICGGFLRDTVLGEKPADCDVVFEGYTLNQPGILECVRDAESRLGYRQSPDWEFENALATGISRNIYEDVIGFYSNHTDYLTLLMYDADGKLRIGSRKTLDCLARRIYEIRYQGLLIWVSFRGRSYFRALSGLACRGLYLCHRLGLSPSPDAESVFRHFNFHFENLTDDERTSLLDFWHKKTASLPAVGSILDQYQIKCLKYEKSET